jgi:hypothetical protein
VSYDLGASVTFLRAPVDTFVPSHFLASGGLRGLTWLRGKSCSQRTHHLFLGCGEVTTKTLTWPSGGMDYDAKGTRCRPNSHSAGLYSSMYCFIFRHGSPLSDAKFHFLSCPGFDSEGFSSFSLSLNISLHLNFTRRVSPVEINNNRLHALSWARIALSGLLIFRAGFGGLTSV